MKLKLICGALAAFGCLNQSTWSENVTSLAGTWAFQLDPDRKGEKEKWFSTALPKEVKLPGSTDENGKGKPEVHKKPGDVMRHLTRLAEYAGPAWYQCEISIPEDWKGRRITLFLERPHWETRVWVDDQPVGMRESLSVPHVYDLTRYLTSRKHRITIRVDNSPKYVLGVGAHSYSENTQTNWNGIVGKIELRASSPVWISDVQVYPNAEKRSAKVKVSIGNISEKGGEGTLVLKGLSIQEQESKVSWNDKGGTAEFDVAFSAETKLWDEFDPQLQDLTIALKGQGISDEKKVAFGLRDFGVDGKKFVLNGRVIFLRGTLECCIFPLTGYPPTEVGPWERIFKICKSYGLNHVRFHSWCPPEAAFIAADRVGILLQPELPIWVADLGHVPDREKFLEEEMQRILDAYGNHPSFAMFSLGNELDGDRKYMEMMVTMGKERDPRHLYTAISNNVNIITDAEQFHVFGSGVRGVKGPPTMHDFSERVAEFRGPVVAHEVGQWAIFPNLEEISKYTGVLRAKNFEWIRDDLKKKGMLDQADDFMEASGKFSVIFYKEDIESQLRTANMGGFQLLDLHDFPGQNTSTVGVLDAFWDSKGLITPEEYRRFCSAAVPLLRMEKRAYLQGEPFKAKAEIANYGPAELAGAEPEWTIRDEKGGIIASGALEKRTIPTGKLSELGTIEASLEKANAPTKLKVSLSLKGTQIANDWDIWVYPDEVDVAKPSDVIIAKEWNERTANALQDGKKVLLFATGDTLARWRPGKFEPAFWSPVRGGIGSLGTLIDSQHPVFKHFPTEKHSNWQWSDLLTDSCSMIIDDAPPKLRPIVQVIDSYGRNHRMGVLLEAKVDNGKLMVCSLPLQGKLDHRPEARQFLHSLYSYMASEDFQPKTGLTSAMTKKLFTPGESERFRWKQEAPDKEKAVLWVEAGKGPASLSDPKQKEMAAWRQVVKWSPQADEVPVQKPGFKYKAGLMRIISKQHGDGWLTHNFSSITVSFPKDFKGKLYVHFQHWAKNSPAIEISEEGEFLTMMGNHAGDGRWMEIPITEKNRKVESITLDTANVQGNAVVRQIALIQD